MEHYRRAGSVELPASSPMPQLPPDTLEMRVRDGSKIRNLLGLALGRLEAGSTRHVVFSGSGRAAGKAVSCAEIVKRRVPGLHQLTKLRFLQTEDSWVPTSPDTGLDPLTVRRHVPAVWVLLSRDPLDPSECGYQPPGAPLAWALYLVAAVVPDPGEGLGTPATEDLWSLTVPETSYLCLL